MYKRLDSNYEVSIPDTHISECCRKKVCKDSKGNLYTVKSAGGYMWEFQESN